jgi:hypothetical protein
MHSVEYVYCPASFTNVWTTNINNQNNELRNADGFTISQPRIEMLKKSPLHSLPTSTLWNLWATINQKFVGAPVAKRIPLGTVN